MPSKTLLKTARVVHQMRNANRYGITSVNPKVDFKSVMVRVREVIDRVYQEESPEALQADGIEVLLGDVRFIDPHTLSVNDTRIEARRFLLATGASSLIPPIDGLESVSYLTYEQIWEMEVLPEQMLIIGAGPIDVRWRRRLVVSAAR